MTQTEWHASDELLDRFAADPAHVDPTRAASLEAHVASCGACRHQLSARLGSSFADASWARVADEIDRPRSSWFERALQGVGVSDGYARILSATPGLRASWAAGVVAVLLVVVAGSRVSEAASLFLVVVPLLPMVVVSAAFLPGADPAGEAGIATPVHGWALAARRTLSVTVGVFALLALAEIAGGALGTPAFAWLLPSMALTTGALALGTWLRAELALGLLASVWVSLVGSVYWTGDAPVTVARSVVFAAPGQWSSLLAFLVGAAVVVMRKDRFETMEMFR